MRPSSSAFRPRAPRSTSISRSLTGLVGPGLLLALCLLAPTGLLAQTAERADTSDGWTSLFDGENLEGWTELNGDHRWTVENGQIVGTSVPGTPNGFLVTERTFGDFILELEVKADVLMNNSGIQFRSLSTEEYRNGRVHGYQAEIDTKPQRWSGSIYDEARRGWLYTMELNPRAQRAFRNNTWNHYRIEAIGPVIRTWVNGVPAAHLIDDETARGFIGLQMHANQEYDPAGPHQIRFRDIRIKTGDVEPSPPTDVFVVNRIPNHLSVQERAQGYSLLWDGRTFRGWTSSEGGDPASSGWSIENGTLAPPGESDANANEASALRTEQSFRAFELLFEFRPAHEGTTCGIDYHVSESGDEPGSEPAGGSASTYCRMAAPNLETGDWNRGRILVRPGGSTEYWLNGEPILEYRQDDPRARGTIRLAGRGSDVSYRSIKIRVMR